MLIQPSVSRFENKRQQYLTQLITITVCAAGRGAARSGHQKLLSWPLCRCFCDTAACHLWLQFTTMLCLCSFSIRKSYTMTLLFPVTVTHVFFFFCCLSVEKKIAVSVFFFFFFFYHLRHLANSFTDNAWWVCKITSKLHYMKICAFIIK